MVDIVPENEGRMHIVPTEPGGPIADPVRQQGNEDNEAPRERKLSPREEMMERIAERRAETIAREVAYGLQREEEQEEEESRSEGEDTSVPAVAPREPEVSPAAPVAPSAPTSLPPTLPPQTFSITLPNGQALSLTADQMVQLAQDGALARLAVAQQRPVQQPTPQAPQAQEPLVDPDLARTTFQKIAYGNSEDGAAALREFGEKIVERVKGSLPDPRVIVNAATQQALAQANLSRNVEIVGTEFPDIFGDPSLTRLAVFKVAEARQQYAIRGIARGDLETYRDACGAVRDLIRPGWRDTRPANETAQPPSASVAPQAVPTVNLSRIERKRAAPQPVTAATRVSSDGNESPWKGDRSSVVDQMRKARGQTPLR